MDFKIFLISSITLISLFNFADAQDKSRLNEKWSYDPRVTGVYPTGEYVPLPQQEIDVPLRTEPIIIQSPSGVYLLNPNFRVHPSTTATQSETIICRHPLNPNILFGSANTIWPPGGLAGISEGVYVSTNGGTSFSGIDTVLSPVITNHGGDPGPVIDKNGTFIISHLGYPASGMYVNYSTNYGASWSANYPLATGQQDKNFSGTDDSPSSPYFGRSYTVWSLFTFAYPPLGFSYTTNGGVSWSSVIQINNPVAGHYCQGCDIRTGPNGEVYVCWANPVAGTPFTEDFAGFAKSTNGGVTWIVTDNAYDMNGIRGNFPNKNNIRVNGFTRIDVDRSGGPRNGWIYIVAAEQNLAPAGSEPDVIIHRSTNGGVTWSAGIRVNQDPLNNGKYQWFPAIRVDEYGGINILYYDDRTVASNQAEVYLSRSIDGGNSWTDTEISDHLFTPAPISGLAAGYQGDYIGITSGNNKVWAMWADNSTGIYQAWMTSFDLGPSISHTPLPNTENLSGPYAVNCVINPAGSAIDPVNTRVLWTRGTSFTDSVQLTNVSGNNWSADIPGNGIQNTYRYYIKTGDLLSRVVTSPAGAPYNYYSFQAAPDITNPVIVHTPLGNIPKTIWPAAVAASVTDNLGLDSVWVRWYKNNTGTGIKHFKLNNTSGSNYSAAFNSTQAEVNGNDSIFYKVFAKDNSANHNTDSTSLYKFRILDNANVCIGTGNTGVTWPYNTYKMDSRADMLYTSGEILANGGASGNITRIGFNVLSPASQVMNGFNIKMQNTSQGSLSGFVSSGWTTVYSGTYAVPGAGWQFIDLQTPFAWNGQNLLIEICYHNTTFTLETTVAGTTMPGLTWERHTDNADGCTLTGGVTQNYRPNLCMNMNFLVGNPIVQSEVPNKFALEQNYPNPFNPSTSIKYSLPKQSWVKIVIYDVLGRETSVLVNELQQPGNYAVPFDGSLIASGVYFYKIDAGDFSDVKKMVLIK
jgi:hypothetical protein